MSDLSDEQSAFSSSYGTQTETPPAEVKEPEAVEVATEVAEPVAEQAAETPQEAPDPIKDVMSRMDRFEASQSKLAGHVGSLIQTHQQLLEASKQAASKVADAPTQAEVQQAAKSPQEWEDLKQDYPEWSAATEKLLEAKLAAVKPTFDQAEFDRIVEQRVANESARVRKESIDSHLDAIVDGDWEKEVSSEGFMSWTRAQPGWHPDFENHAFVNQQMADPNSAMAQWVAANPNHVASLYVSSRLRDAARMLRMYQQAKQSPEAKPQTPQPSARQKRLESAVTPRSGAAAPRTAEETEAEAFSKAY